MNGSTMDQPGDAVPHPLAGLPTSIDPRRAAVDAMCNMWLLLHWSIHDYHRLLDDDCEWTWDQVVTDMQGAHGWAFDLTHEYARAIVAALNAGDTYDAILDQAMTEWIDREGGTLPGAYYRRRGVDPPTEPTPPRTATATALSVPAAPRRRWWDVFR